jgi:hypothetical protein
MKPFEFKTLGLHSVIGIVLGAAASTLLAPTSAVASTAGLESSLSRVAVPSASDFTSGSFTCTPEHLAVVTERQQRIAEASTVEEARDLALTPARVARRALQIAAMVVPSSEKLTEARARLEGFEARVQESETPVAVADEFGRLLDLQMRSGNLVQVADLEVGNAEVSGPGGCHYSTGEIVAIVIGFILFIIPGIILLFVLC